MTLRQIEAVVIGASAGAFDALSVVLPAFPANAPLAVMVVVHLPPDKNSLMTHLMQAKCAMNVREAEDKQAIDNGAIYFAPPDYHLLIEADRRLSLSSEEPVRYSRPSIDVLFESAADAYGPSLAGVILTGANDDGARGLRAVVAADGLAVIQRPDLAYATAMPLAAIAACPTAVELSLEEIADYLLEVTSRQ